VLPTLALVAMTLLILVLVENSRIPVDDPTTHLELTMIHEVMVLDHSGPDLGLIQYATALKLWIFGSLLVGLVVPLHDGNLVLDGAAMLFGMAVLSLAIGMIESAMARYRLVQVPQFIVGAATLSAVGFILILV
jgi:formate hydrogenlyase subunit 4